MKRYILLNEECNLNKLSQLKVYFILLCLITLTGKNVLAQDLKFSLVPKTYPGGYNVSCFGSSDGEITIHITEGLPPYKYIWSTGDTSYQIKQVPAGVYTVSVKDGNGIIYNSSITLNEPSKLQGTLNGSNYNGYGLKGPGTQSGYINWLLTGGSPPYNYQWSNGSVDAEIIGLPAGLYSCTLADANGCVITGNYQLTEPDVLQLNVNVISAVSCSDGSDGKAEVQITGGVQPYVISWDDGEIQMSDSHLKAGLHYVMVADANNQTAMVNFSIPGPAPIQLTYTNSNYGNDTEVSCDNCQDGFINLNISGGTAPYNISWNDGTAGNSANLTGIKAGLYKAQITDDKGCEASVMVNMRAPQFTGWNLNGNAGLSPSQNFLGTTDTTAFSIKSNNSDNIVLKSNSTVFNKPVNLQYLQGPQTPGDLTLIGVDGNGNVISSPVLGGVTLQDPVNSVYCNSSTPLFPWQHPQFYNPQTGVVVPNSIITNEIFTCGDISVGIGGVRPHPSAKLFVKGSQSITGKLSIGHPVVSSFQLQVFGNSRINNELEVGQYLEVGGNGNFSGSVGIGVQNPTEKLKVVGSTFLNGPLTTTHDVIHYDYSSNSFVKIALDGANAAIDFFGPISGGRLSLNYNSDKEVLIGNGLQVLGNITSCKVKVETAVWCDYVFEDNYHQMSLDELECYYKTHKHLPHIPSADEILEKGLNLGEIQMLQMEKIEEIVKYLVELKHENEELNKRLAEIERN